LKESKKPQVINITARLEGNLYQSHASSAKAAIDSLIKNLAVEWVPYGIRVNGIGLFSFVSYLK
jgi:2,4-dienoyl-CoA reductase [(3E)-enoyl-CoA-producing], peroxisomal